MPQSTTSPHPAGGTFLGFPLAGFSFFQSLLLAVVGGLAMIGFGWWWMRKKRAGKL